MGHKFSAVIIASNEAKHIGRCLDSLVGFVDEIVVVISTNSTDATERICRNYTSNVTTRNFEGYGAQKHFATQQASNDFILSIDADEALDDTLQQELLSLKNSSVIADGYTVGIVNFYCGKWMRFGGINSTKRLRIFNRNLGNWNNAPVHEKIILNPASVVQHLQGSIRHIAFESKQEHIDKLASYTLLSAKDLAKKSCIHLYWKLIFSSTSKFIASYIFKLGFIEGIHGFQFAQLKCYETWLKYSKAIALKRKTA